MTQRQDPPSINSTLVKPAPGEVAIFLSFFYQMTAFLNNSEPKVTVY